MRSFGRNVLGENQRREALRDILSFDASASLKLAWDTQEVYHYIDISNKTDPRAWERAKGKVLERLSLKQQRREKPKEP